MPSFGREEVDVCIVGSGAGGGPLRPRARACRRARGRAREGTLVPQGGFRSRRDRQYPPRQVGSQRRRRAAPAAARGRRDAAEGHAGMDRQLRRRRHRALERVRAPHASRRLPPEDESLRQRRRGERRRLAHRLRRLGAVLRQGRARDRRVRRGRGTPVRPAALRRLSAAAAPCQSVVGADRPGRARSRLAPVSRRRVRSCRVRTPGGRHASTATSAAATDARSTPNPARRRP